MLLCISLSVTKLILLTAVSYTSPNKNENITGFFSGGSVLGRMNEFIVQLIKWVKI